MDKVEPRLRRLLTIIPLIVLPMACREGRWVEYSPEDGSFRASFPVSPTKTTKTVNTVAGPMSMTLYTASGKQTAYSVVVADFSADHVNQVGSTALLDGARDGAVATTQGKLLSEEILDVDGHPGRELKVSVAEGKGTVRCKIILVGNRLYQVLVTTPSADAYAATVRRFLDSFSPS